MSSQGGQLARRLPTGATINLLARDQHHRELYFTGRYEPDVTGLFERYARPGWTVLDVGANAGYYSLLAADLGGPTSQIHAFEPNPELLALLRLSASGHPIAVHDLAVSNHHNGATLYKSGYEANSGLASLLHTDRAFLTPTRVPTVTLDEFCETEGVTPDLLKIDVEGHEMAVLDGASALLERRIPAAIVVELAPPLLTVREITEIADRYGYRIRSLKAGGDQPLDTNTFQNVVLVRDAVASS
jgi:FkbM family methyltransferase